MQILSTHVGLRIILFCHSIMMIYLNAVMRWPVILLIMMSQSVFAQSNDSKDSLFHYCRNEAINVFKRVRIDISDPERVLLYQTSISYYNKALEIYPNDTGTLYNKAFMFSMLREYDSAFAIHKRIEPYLFKIGSQASLGEDYFFMGDSLMAERYFEMALVQCEHDLNDIVRDGFYGGHEYNGLIYKKARLLLLLGEKDKFRDLLSNIHDRKERRSIKKLLNKTKAQLLTDI